MSFKRKGVILNPLSSHLRAKSGLNVNVRQSTKLKSRHWSRSFLKKATAVSSPGKLVSNIFHFPWLNIEQAINKQNGTD